MTGAGPAFPSLSDDERARWLAFLAELDERMSRRVMHDPHAIADPTIMGLTMLLSAARSAPDSIYLQLRGIALALDAARAWVEDAVPVTESGWAELLPA